VSTEGMGLGLATSLAQPGNNRMQMANSKRKTPERNESLKRDITSV